MTSASHGNKRQAPLRITAYGLGALAVIAFGATLPVTRIALEGYSPGFITFARAVIATLCAAFLILVFRLPLRHKKERAIFLAGVLLIFGFPGFMALAMETVPAVHGGVVLGFLPLATALIARGIAGEKPSPFFYGMSMLGCSVVAVFAWLKTDETGQTGLSIGDFWLVAAGLSAACGYVIFGKLSRETPGWEIISRALLLNFPLTLAGALWFYEPAILEVTNASLWALLYLGTFSMFIAFCAWNAALAMGGIARIGQLQLLQIFVTIAIASLLLGENVSLATWATAILVTAIIALTRKT